MSQKVKLPEAVVKTLEIEGVTVVLFETEDPEERNIVAFFEDGTTAWRIGLIEGSKSQYYTNIWIGLKGELIAGCWAGYDMVVDPKTGAVTPWRDPAWPPGYKPRPW
jgi:hypothetical protein